MGNHLSGTNVTDSLKRLSVGARSMASSTPRLAPGRGLPSQHLSMLLVRSYRTFAPLPRLLGFPHQALGGVFLWHYPHGHPHWELPSKLGHQGARTFLNGLLFTILQEELHCDHLSCFHHPSCLEGIIHSSGAVAQLDRATVS